MFQNGLKTKMSFIETTFRVNLNMDISVLPLEARTFERKQIFQEDQKTICALIQLVYETSLYEKCPKHSFFKSLWLTSVQPYAMGTIPYALLKYTLIFVY